MNYESGVSNFEEPFPENSSTKTTEENWTWIILLGVMVVSLIIFGIWVYFITQPSSQKKGSVIPHEKIYDPSIKTPTNTMILGMFTINPQDSYPWCLGTWYAIRYVRKTDGGYGKLGPWTKNPVISGEGQKFGDTCKFNQVFMGLPVGTKLDYEIITDFNNWSANVHRQTGKFDPTSEGMVVGFLTGAGGNYDLEYMISPPEKNPNINIEKCKNC